MSAPGASIARDTGTYGPAFRREYEHGRIRGVVSQIAVGEFIWWCWRTTGRTKSGVAPSIPDAEAAIGVAMEGLA